MELVVLTPEKEYFKGKVDSVIVPGIDGEIGVLENHAPLVSSIAKGIVKIRKDNGDIIKFNVNQGFLEVINNDLALLVNELDVIE